jgi:hypothetical protein
MKASIVGALGGKRKRVKMRKLDDFQIIKYPKQKKSWQQMLSLVETLNSRFGGKDKRKKG